MAFDDMLDDRQAEPGAARFAAARGIDPIKALGQARQMIGGDPVARDRVDPQQRPPAVAKHVDP